jgi:hypothetical protein
VATNYGRATNATDIGLQSTLGLMGCWRHGDARRLLSATPASTASAQISAQSGGIRMDGLVDEDEFLGIFPWNS